MLAGPAAAVRAEAAARDHLHLLGLIDLKKKLLLGLKLLLKRAASSSAEISTAISSSYST